MFPESVFSQNNGLLEHGPTRSPVFQKTDLLNKQVWGTWTHESPSFQKELSLFWRKFYVWFGPLPPFIQTHGTRPRSKLNILVALFSSYASRTERDTAYTNLLQCKLVHYGHISDKWYKQRTQLTLPGLLGLLLYDLGCILVRDAFRWIRVAETSKLPVILRP